MLLPKKGWTKWPFRSLSIWYSMIQWDSGFEIKPVSFQWGKDNKLIQQFLHQMKAKVKWLKEKCYFLSWDNSVVFLNGSHFLNLVAFFYNVNLDHKKLFSDIISQDDFSLSYYFSLRKDWSALTAQFILIRVDCGSRGHLTRQVWKILLFKWVISPHEKKIEKAKKTNKGLLV